MLEEFLISKIDGRCLYYLSKDYKHDPQLISGYLASLIVFMKLHQDRMPKTIILDKGQWIIEFDQTDEFFVAASILSENGYEGNKSREILVDILNSITLIAGSRVIPIEDDEDPVREIIDQTIKSKLIELIPEKEALKYQPGILAVNILN